MIKKILFLAVGLAAVSLNVSPMGEDVCPVVEDTCLVDGCNWLCKTKEATGGFAKNAYNWAFPTREPAKQSPLFGEKSSNELLAQLVQSKKNIAKVKASVLDSKAAEEMQREWVGYKPGILGFLGFKNHMSHDAQVGETNDLSKKVEALDSVSTCLDKFERNLGIAGKRTKEEAGNIVDIGNKGIQKLVGDDYTTAKDVNNYLLKPYNKLRDCLAPSHLRHSKDKVVVAGRDEALKLADVGKEYEQNLKLIENSRKAYDKEQAKIDAAHEKAELKEWCEQRGTSTKCLWGSTKMVVGEKYDWAADKANLVADGWRAVGNKVDDVKGELKNTDWNQQWATVRDVGTSPENYGIENAVIQGGKIMGAAIVTLAGLWALYKAGKISLSVLRGFWNMSKKAKLATILVLGSAVAVAPSAIMAASPYVQSSVQSLMQ